MTKVPQVNRTMMVGDAIKSKYESINNFSTYPGAASKVDSDLTKITSNLISDLHKKGIRISEDAIKSFISSEIKQNGQMFRYQSQDIDLESYIEITRRLLVYSNEYPKLIEGRK